MRLALLVLPLLLQGCLFFFVAPAGEPGNLCLSRAAKVGEETKMADGGQRVRITRIYGINEQRCKDPRRPVIGEGEFLYQ